MMVPLLVGVIDAEQLDVVALTFDNVHGVPLNEPDAVPTFVNATVPAGALAVPVEASFTNAVHEVDCATTIDVGEHVTVVEVARAVTVTVLLVAGPLLLWTPSVAV